MSAIIVLVHHCPSCGCLSLIPLHCYYYCCLIRHCCYCCCFHLPSCSQFWAFSLWVASLGFLFYSTFFGLATSLEQLWKDREKNYKIDVRPNAPKPHIRQLIFYNAQHEKRAVLLLILEARRKKSIAANGGQNSNQPITGSGAAVIKLQLHMFFFYYIPQFSCRS